MDDLLFVLYRMRGVISYEELKNMPDDERQTLVSFVREYGRI